jgi:predicted  nucleic acid-binding Zn-ribbon protein
MKNIEERIDELASKIIRIESQVSKINESKDWDYQKVLSAIKYLYRYYDDMTKDKDIDIK